VDETSTTPDRTSADTDDESPPAMGKPHVTSDPSDLRAAKASRVENNWLTPDERPAETPEESPPRLERPHVTTEPSALRAAAAPKIC
jgi:hypothetical protein